MSAMGPEAYLSHTRGRASITGLYPQREMRRTPSTSAIYETLRRSRELRESLSQSRPSSRLSFDNIPEKLKDTVSLGVLPLFLARRKLRPTKGADDHFFFLFRKTGHAVLFGL